MASCSSFLKLLSIIFIILSLLTPKIVGEEEGCSEETDICHDKSSATPLKLIAIASILFASIIGVGSPLVTKSIPALKPDTDIFVIVKLFAGGIILATGCMHVMPDSFEMLSSSCLKDNPWHTISFTGFFVMVACIVTMMIDSVATSWYTQNMANRGKLEKDVSHGVDQEMGESAKGQFHEHHHGMKTEVVGGQQLLRYRVVAMVLELGIIVHSVVIGLSLGASNNTCSIKGLIAALCFHQMFEGMGLGGCILQAEYKFLKKAAMAFFFAVTTPLGIAIGMGLTKTYDENSPTALITVGLLNASSAGLLIYMALVDIIAAEFFGPRLQASIKLQFQCGGALLVGAGAMSLLAKWA